jgi:hypothetical protein
VFAPVVAAVVLPVAVAVVVTSVTPAVTAAVRRRAPLRIALVAVLPLVGVPWLLAPVLIAVLAVVLLLLLRGALVAVSLTAFGLLWRVRLRNGVGAGVQGMRRVAVFEGGSTDGFCLVGVWGHCERRGPPFLFHLFGDVERNVNGVRLAHPLARVGSGIAGGCGCRPTVHGARSGRLLWLKGCLGFRVVLASAATSWSRFAPFLSRFC